MSAADERVTGEVGDEESIDLTPDVVWTDSQLVVVRELAARAFRAEEKRAALVKALEGLADRMRQAAYRGHQDGELVAAAVIQTWHDRIRAVLDEHR